jgi:hypothetical protein
MAPKIETAKRNANDASDTVHKAPSGANFKQAHAMCVWSFQMTPLASRVELQSALNLRGLVLSRGGIFANRSLSDDWPWMFVSFW